MHLNPDKLRSMNVSMSDVFTALQKNNQNTGGAYIDKNLSAYFICSEGLIGTKEDIEKIVINGAYDLLSKMKNSEEEEEH